MLTTEYMTMFSPRCSTKMHHVPGLSATSLQSLCKTKRQLKLGWGWRYVRSNAKIAKFLLTLKESPYLVHTVYLRNLCHRHNDISQFDHSNAHLNKDLTNTFHLYKIDKNNQVKATFKNVKNISSYKTQWYKKFSLLDFSLIWNLHRINKSVHPKYASFMKK